MLLTLRLIKFKSLPKVSATPCIMNSTDPESPLDSLITMEEIFCRCSRTFYHLDSWWDAVVMVGVMSVNTQLAQSSSVHVRQQDWPRDTWAKRPCWQPQDVNLLPGCQHLRCEMRCDDFFFNFIFFIDRILINWQPSALWDSIQRL